MNKDIKALRAEITCLLVKTLDDAEGTAELLDALCCGLAMVCVSASRGDDAQIRQLLSITSGMVDRVAAKHAVSFKAMVLAGGDPTVPRGPLQ